MPSRPFTGSTASSSARPLAASLAACALLALTACGTGSDAAAPSDGERTREVASDHQDAPVEVPAEPRRIVTLGWATGPLLEIEDSPLVGAADATTRDYAPKSRERFEKLPKVGMRTDINIEQVAKLEPDLILSGIPAAADMDYDRLAEIAPVVVSAPTIPADWKKTTERVWDAAGLADEGAALAQTYEERATEVERAVADSPAADMVFAAAGDGKESGLKEGDWMLEFRDSWSTTVLGDAGLEFLPLSDDKRGNWSAGLSYEELDRLDDVDAVLVPAGEDGEPTSGSELLMEQGPWKETAPVKAGRAYPLTWGRAASYRTGVLLFDEFEKKVLTDL